MLVRPGQSVVTEFTTQNPSTGAAQNVDAGVPTATLVRNGVDTAVVVTVANKEVGVYSASFTVPSSYAAGDVLMLRVAATVNAIAGKGDVWYALVSLSTILVAGAIEYTYTVTNSLTGLPLDGVEVWFTTDLAHANIVWKGETDALGIARDTFGNKPWLDAGTYYVWKVLGGYIDNDNPDTEIVS